MSILSRRTKEETLPPYALLYRSLGSRFPHTKKTHFFFSVGQIGGEHPNSAPVWQILSIVPAMSLCK